MIDNYSDKYIPNDEALSLNEKINSLPKLPGIYQFKNKSDRIIYIGKAKDLRNRVRSYFQKSKPQDAKTKAMLVKITDIEVIIVDSEAEALILEDTLIKKYKPRYNVLLRDDKSFPYVRITNEPFPRIFPTRKVIRDGSKYFGPFTEVRYLKQVLKMLRSIFLFRSCDLKLNVESIENKKFKICLDYHIGKCEGPCEGLTSAEKYKRNVKLAIQVLNGKTKDLEKHLEQEMLELASQLKFEEAGIYKRRLELLREYESKQKIVSTELIDRDVIGLSRFDEAACSLIFKIRDGKLIGKRHYIITDVNEITDEAIIQRTLERWYLESEFIPKEIFLPCESEQYDFILNWISSLTDKSVHIHIPKVGEKRKLVEMANYNASFIVKEFKIAKENRDKTIIHSVSALQRDLRLNSPPMRIECFDNSHLQGTDIVSSMVVFYNGKPKKSDYRKYKIKSVNKNDDFASMREVVQRRYSKLMEEGGELPQLIVIDGGKGQLSVAYKVITELGLSDKMKIIGLAKKLEEIFIPGNSEPILLPRTSSSLKLLQQIRDEAHRFAITFHRLLREKRTLVSELSEIRGIGDKTASKLLNTFGSVENIKSTEKNKIADIFGNSIAEKIYQHFHNS